MTHETAYTYYAVVDEQALETDADDPLLYTDDGAAIAATESEADALRDFVIDFMGWDPHGDQAANAVVRELTATSVGGDGDGA